MANYEAIMADYQLFTNSCCQTWDSFLKTNGPCVNSTGQGFHVIKAADHQMAFCGFCIACHGKIHCPQMPCLVEVIPGNLNITLKAYPTIELAYTLNHVDF